MLEVKNLTIKYGNIAAVRDISFQVKKGEIITIIGANGAGKSTTLNAVAGIKNVYGGELVFEKENITKLSPQERVRKGIILAPEGRQIFPEMTVRENLLMGGYLQKQDMLNQTFDLVFELFPILKKRIRQVGGTLSGGEQQMLCIGRALMSNPKLLMLDEPSLGLAPLIVKEIFYLIQKIRNLGCTILLVEQNARMALNISDRAYVMQTGKIILQGDSKEIAQKEAVKNAYLG